MIWIRTIETVGCMPLHGPVPALPSESHFGPSRPGGIIESIEAYSGVMNMTFCDSD
jgi:hypothetical protein